MSKNKTAKGRGGIIVAFLGLAYFSSYLLRYSYVVSMAAVQDAIGLSDSQAGAVVAAFTFAYAIGQIVCGVLGDRLDPARMIFAGLMIGVGCNLLFPFCGGQATRIAVWAVDGLSQAMLWPPIVRYMATRFPGAKYGSGIAFIASMSSLANVLMYLFVPLILKHLSWDWVFVFVPAVALVIAFAWLIVSHIFGRSAPPVQNIQAPTPEKSAPLGKEQFFGLLISCGIIFIFVGIAMQGFLRDGVTDWVPMIMRTTFGLTTENSILVTAAVAATSAVSAYLFNWIYGKFFKSEVVVAFTLFVAIAALAGVLFPFHERSAALTLVLLVVIVGLANGINLMLITFVPRRFARYGRASTVSGVTNAFTYVGSGIASSVTGFVSASGWGYVTLMWSAIAAFGALVLMLAIRPWKKFTSDKK